MLAALYGNCHADRCGGRRMLAPPTARPRAGTTRSTLWGPKTRSTTSCDPIRLQQKSVTEDKEEYYPGRSLIDAVLTSSCRFITPEISCAINKVSEEPDNDFPVRPVACLKSPFASGKQILKHLEIRKMFSP